MDTCCPKMMEEEEKSENVRTIRRNIEEFMWKVGECKWVENQEKYTLALFKKLATVSTIEELANMTIDMWAALQKIKLKKENKEVDAEEKMWDEVFIELFKIDAPKTKDETPETAK